MKTREQIQQEWNETLEKVQDGTNELKSWSRPNRWSDQIWNADFLYLQENLLTLCRLRHELYTHDEIEAARKTRLESSAEGGGST